MSDTHVHISIVDSPSEARIYHCPEYKSLILESVVIVGKGTQSGKPTVDLVFVDPGGQKYVSLVKGSFIEGVGGAVTGKCLRDSGEVSPQQEAILQLREQVERLVSHSAAVAVGFAEDVRDIADESWRALPDDLQALINAEEERLIKDIEGS